MLEIVKTDIMNESYSKSLNSNWELILSAHDSTSFEPFTGNTYINFKFVFKRRSQYFILNLFGPVILLTLLEFFAFLIPPDTIERTMYSATIMLAMFVLHDQILSYLPQTPQQIVVANYVMMVMSFGTFCTFYAALMFWTISKSKSLHQTLSKWNFQLFNIIDSVCFLIMLIFISAANVYCWQKTDNQ